MFKLLDLFLDRVSGKLASNLMLNLDEARENMRCREEASQLQREATFKKETLPVRTHKNQAKIAA